MRGELAVDADLIGALGALGVPLDLIGGDAAEREPEAGREDVAAVAAARLAEAVVEDIEARADLLVAAAAAVEAAMGLGDLEGGEEMERDQVAAPELALQVQVRDVQDAQPVRPDWRHG